MRNSNPIDDDDDDIKEGSIHGMAVPLNESLFADIGTDDMSGFADADKDLSEFAAKLDEQQADIEPAITYDLDADEPPTMSVGPGTGETEPELVGEVNADYIAARNEYESSDAEAQSEFAQSVEDGQIEEQTQYEYSAQPDEQNQYEYSSQPEEQNQYEYASQPEEQNQYEFPTQPEQTQEQNQHGDSSPSEQAEEPPYAVPTHLYSGSGEAQPTSEFKQYTYEDTEPTSEAGIPSHLYGDEQSHASAPDYDPGALDSIGTAANAIDQGEAEAPIERPRSKPAGILSKFTGKRDASKSAAPHEPPTEEPKKLDSAAFDSIGTGSGGKGFDSSSLDAIGLKGGFDSAALDSIGSKTKFDSAALDSIGAKNNFDSAALDSIGSQNKFDAASLDAIGTAAETASVAANEPKEKTAPKGGLLGGKFGQRAKADSKPKLGAVQPSSNDPTMPQKETGLFMLNKSEILEKADRIRAQGGQYVDEAQTESTYEAEQQEGTYAAAPAEPGSETPIQETYEASSLEDSEAAASASSGGSFFDEASEPFDDEHVMPDTANDEIARLLTDADNAYRLRQFKAAEPIFANVLDKLDKAGDDADPLLPYCLDRMGDNFYQLKRFNEALPVYRRLLQLQTKISATDRDMISTLYKIAQTSEALNLTSEADSMYKRAFRLGQQSLVPGDPLLAKVLEGYGTMLMRSEGAEPPAAASPESAATETSTDSTEKATSLSADDIAALNALKVKADDPSPIILSGGPVATPAADTSLARSGSRTPLRESEERTDRRASGPSPGGTTTGGMYVRLGLFIAIIAGLLLVVFNFKSDFSSKQITHSKDFKAKVYKTLDGASTFTIANEDEATKDAFGKKFLYKYTDWNGTPSDDLSVITGQVGGDSFVYMVPQGLKDSDGLLFYEADAPERSIVAKMKELGAKAQEKYKSEGHYPEGKELEQLGSSIGYKNQFGDAGVTANSIAWPPLMDASQVFVKSRFDNSLEQGGTWEAEAPAKPGQISAVSSSQKSPDASILYIHGRDRDGNLLKRADGKVLILSFKNGIDVTPSAADTGGQVPTPEPKSIKIAKSGAPINVVSVLMGYAPILFFVILTFVFLAMANKGADPTKGFNVASFGMIWAPIMVLLTVLMKMAPASLYPIALGATLVGLVGGLGLVAFKAISTRPKKPKKPKIEASSM